MPEQTSDAAATGGGGERGGRQASKTGNMIAMFVCAAALGLLIWAKLQLVAGVPRTAIAAPEQQPQQKEQERRASASEESEKPAPDLSRH